MSAPFIESRLVEDRPRTEVRHYPVAPSARTAKPDVRVRVRIVEQTPRRVSRVAVVTGKALMFGAVAFVAFSASSLAGNVMVESSRCEGIRAVARANEARAAEANLQNTVDRLSSVSAIEEWAQLHGFVAPDQLAKSAAAHD
jgi:hypothetical protein